MAFTVQDDTGDIAGANAYVSVAYFDAYHTERGNAYTGSPSSTEKEQAIVLATDYLDIRFNYVGLKRVSTQTTEWPRYSARDRDGRLVSGLPEVVKEAICEYALRALTATLVADPSRDASGNSIVSESVKADVVESRVQYSSGQGFVMPSYPLADKKLLKSGLIVSGGNILRS